MKTKHLVYSLALAAACAAPLSAQPAGPPPDGAPPQRHGEGPRGKIDPQEREKMKAAREKAMQDPKVQAARQNVKQAREDLFKITGPLLLAEDSSLQPILDKWKAAQEAPEAGKPHGEGGLHGPGHDGPMGTLTPEEREKLRGVQEKIKDNAEVRAGRDKLRDAEKALREAMHSAMLAADPSIAPMLEKTEQMRPRGGGPGHHGPGEGGGENASKPADANPPAAQ